MVTISPSSLSLHHRTVLMDLRDESIKDVVRSTSSSHSILSSFLVSMPMHVRPQLSFVQFIRMFFLRWDLAADDADSLMF